MYKPHAVATVLASLALGIFGAKNSHAVFQFVTAVGVVPAAPTTGMLLLLTAVSTVSGRSYLTLCLVGTHMSLCLMVLQQEQSY